VHLRIGLALSENFFTCIFLGAGLGAMDQFRGPRAHPISIRMICSSGDTLRALFARPLWPFSINWSSELLPRSKKFRATAEEHSNGNWIPLGHFTCYERRVCCSCYTTRYLFYNK
jgi:hypothetical protein